MNRGEVVLEEEWVRQHNALASYRSRHRSLPPFHHSRKRIDNTMAQPNAGDAPRRAAGRLGRFVRHFCNPECVPAGGR